MPGAPLSLPEREEIARALIEDREVSWASIGDRVGRHPATVAREVARKGGRDRYRAAVADRRAQRCRRRPRDRVLARPGELRDRVRAELVVGRSPEAIWADLVADGAPLVCVETIYEAV
ncbi:MAG: helix-turn-helix domain-containing protein [Desertimonas sp.]